MSFSIFIRFILTLVFLAASVANGSHSIEWHHHDCDEETVLSDQGMTDIVHHFEPVESEHGDDFDSHDQQHRCCHSHSFLSNSQCLSLLVVDQFVVGISPKHMISDPHVRGPFQPPKA